MIVIVLAIVGITAIIYGVISGQFLILVVGLALVVATLSGRFGQANEQSLTHIVTLVRRAWQVGVFQFIAIPLTLSTLAGVVTQQSPLSPISGILWLLAMAALLVVAARRRLKSPDVPEQTFAGWGAWDWTLIIVITIVGVALRLYKLDDVLPPFHGDEGEMGQLALRVLQFQEIPPEERVPLFSAAFLGHPTLFHYVQAGAMAIFGRSDIGLRILSVIFGATCIPLIYLIARLHWGPIASASAAWLIAVSHLYIQYSRISLNNIHSVWFTVLFMFLLGLIDNRQDHSDSLLPVITGLVMGVAQYFYYGSRLILVLAPLLLVHSWRHKRVTGGQIALIAIACLVAYLPMLFFFDNNSSALMERTQGVFIFSDGNVKHTLGPDAKLPEAAPVLIARQTQATLAFFIQNGTGDNSAFYWPDAGGFDIVTSSLFWLGLAVAFVHIRRYEYFALLVWFWVGVTISGVLTNDAPNGPRMIVAIPSLFLIAGAFIQRVAELVGRLQYRFIRAAFGGVLVVSALITLALNYETYFVRYRTYSPNTLPTFIAKQITQDSDRCSFYLVGLPYLSVNYGTIRFIAREADMHDANADSAFPRQVWVDGNERQLCFIVLPAYKNIMGQLALQYPGGVQGTGYDNAGRELYSYFYSSP